MNRSLWTQTLSKTSCPVCKNGSLALVQKLLVYHETIESKGAHNHESWDPDWISYTFTAWAECRHPTCKQDFAIAGTGGVCPEIGADGDYEWEEYFVPMICQPMPDIVEIPAKPEGSQRRASSRVYIVLVESSRVRWPDSRRTRVPYEPVRCS